MRHLIGGQMGLVPVLVIVWVGVAYGWLVDRLLAIRSRAAKRAQTPEPAGLVSESSVEPAMADQIVDAWKQNSRVSEPDETPVVRVAEESLTRR